MSNYAMAGPPPTTLLRNTHYTVTHSHGVITKLMFPSTIKDLYLRLPYRENDVGSNGLIHQEKADILMSRWRMPALSIHGIEGAFSEPGSKTVIPSKVIGKFSIR